MSKKSAIFFTLWLLLQCEAFISITSSSGARTFVGKRNSYILGNSDASSTTPNTQNDILKNNLAKNSNSGLTSAWRLILFILFIIVLLFTAYYGIICLPFLCRNEKSYQFMDVSSTITGATSQSIQSMDNFHTEKLEEKV